MASENSGISIFGKHFVAQLYQAVLASMDAVLWNLCAIRTSYSIKHYGLVAAIGGGEESPCPAARTTIKDGP